MSKSTACVALLTGILCSPTLPLFGIEVKGVPLLAETDRSRIWLSYPPEKIFKTDRLDDAAQVPRIVLSAARGEFEPFILVLRPKDRKPLMDIQFDVPVLRSPHNRTESNSLPTIEWRRIGYVQVDAPSGTSVFADTRDRFLKTTIPFGGLSRTGFIPDRLIPAGKVVAEPAENTQFWFTVHIPRTAAPGTYRGPLQLKMRGADSVQIPMEIRVFSFSLPRTPPLRNTTCWSPQYLHPPWTGDQLKALYRSMARHGQTPDPILPQPGLKIDAKGEVKVDTAAYENMLGYCMNELGMPHAFFPRAGSVWYTNVYFLWHAPAVRKQRWYGTPIFDKELQVTPAFRKVFGAYIRQILPIFRRLRCLDRIAMTTMDEPHSTDDLKAIRRFGEFVKSVAPGLRLFCTTYPRPELAGIIDVWCPQEVDRDAFPRSRADDDALMFYKNWVSLIDMPMVNPRLYGWIAWRIGAAGWLTYAAMGRWDRAWDDPYVIYPNTGIKAWGLGLLWYPDPLGTGVLTSIRWEMMREGIEDYEYLAMLRKRIDSLPVNRRHAPEAEAARSFLDSVVDHVLPYPGVLPAGRKDGWQERPAFVRSNRVVWELRNRAAHWLEVLSPTPVPQP